MFELSENEDHIIFKGEEIVCENGHLVCTFIDNMDAGDVWIEKIGNWQIPKPAHGSYPVCHCGAIFWHAIGEYHYFNVKNRGWIS